MNLKALFIDAAIAPTAPYKLINNTELAYTLYALICNNKSNKAYQSVVMQVGLSLGKTGNEAFALGAEVINKYKDIGLYTLVVQAKPYIKPLLVFSKEEAEFLEDYFYETHYYKEPSYDCVLGKYHKATGYENMLFLRKINKVAFTLDMDTVLNFKGKNMPNNYLAKVAEYMDQDVYFSWKFDKRGRSYSEGYGINIQGNDTCVANLLFSNKELVDDINSLYVALANAFGMDKTTWEERLIWGTKQYIAKEFTIPEGCEYPEKYTQTIRAILDTLEGTPTGYMMELDATSSGIQIMSALVGCTKSAKLCNVVSTGNREDVYQDVADGLDLPRKPVKKALMTKYYNSELSPKKLLGNKYEEFVEITKDLLPAGDEVMELFNECWSNHKKEYSWVLPDGHKARFKVMATVESRYKLGEFNIPFIFKVNRGSENFRSLVPNIIHSIDGYIARQMVLRSNFDLVHKHDCFFFHPNNLEAVKELYRVLLAEINSTGLLNNLLRQLGHKTVDIKDISKLILKSEYALS